MYIQQQGWDSQWEMGQTGQAGSSAATGGWTDGLNDSCNELLNL